MLVLCLYSKLHYIKINEPLSEILPRYSNSSMPPKQQCLNCAARSRQLENHWFVTLFHCAVVCIIPASAGTFAYDVT